MATRGNVLDRVTDLLEDKSTTTRTRITPWVGFVLSEMKISGILGPDATTTINTVAATATYNLPTDVDHIDSVYIEDNNGEPLTFKSEPEFAGFLADDDDFAGTPEYYTLPLRNTGGVTPTIRLFPVPDAVWVLRVNYKANFVALSDDANVLQLTDDLFATCVWGVYRIWTRIEQRDDIVTASQEFRLSLAKAKHHQYSTWRSYRTKFRDL